MTHSLLDNPSKIKLGSERHTTEVILNKNGALRVTSGVDGLALLKTTQVIYFLP